MELTKLVVGFYILAILTGLCSTLQLNLILLQRRLTDYGKKRRVLTILLQMDTKRHKEKRKKRQRRFWTRPGRTSSWWNNFKDDIVLEEEWRENFRMSKATFYKLCNELRPYLQKQRTNMREPLAVDTRVAITLYYLSDEGRYRKVANAFGIGRSTVSTIVMEVTNLISSKLGPKFIKFPSSFLSVDRTA